MITKKSTDGKWFPNDNSFFFPEKLDLHLYSIQELLKSIKVNGEVSQENYDSLVIIKEQAEMLLKQFNEQYEEN